MILGRKSFIKEVLRRLEDKDRKEVSHRRALHASAVDLDDIVARVAARFRISREAVRTSFPYRNYAVYLARKHTTLTNPQIGAYFGNVTFSAVAKTVSRLRARMKEDRKVRQALQKLEEELSTVKG